MNLKRFQERIRRETQSGTPTKNIFGEITKYIHRNILVKLERIFLKEFMTQNV